MLTLCGQSFAPVWTDFGGGVTWTATRRKAVNETGGIRVLEDWRAAGCRGRRSACAYRNAMGCSGARAGMTTSRPCAGSFGTIDRRHGDASLSAHLRATARSLCPGVPPPAHRRLPRHSQFPSSHPISRGRGQAHHRRPVDGGLSVIPTPCKRLRRRRLSSGNPCLARAYCGTPGTAGTLWPSSWPAPALLRLASQGRWRRAAAHAMDA